MKILFTIVLLSSMLFSVQIEKQIILGSYSVNTNGVNAARTLNKQIENDEKLKAFMKKNSLNVINTTISGYTVVSVHTFNSYTALFRGMRHLQKYYSDAYVLNHPAGDIEKKEVLQEVEQKAIEEQKLEEERLEQERINKEMLAQIELEGFAKKKLEEERLEKERLQELALKKLEEEKRLEEELKSQRLQKEKIAKQEKKELKRLKNINTKKDEGIGLSNYYLIIFFAGLILIIGSAMVSSKLNKKDENSQTDKKDENLEIE